jgi:hypothetical protein
MNHDGPADLRYAEALRRASADWFNCQVHGVHKRPAAALERETRPEPATRLAMGDTGEGEVE